MKHDLIGIGIGPFNLGLAALLEQPTRERNLSTVFLDQRPGFTWHGGMLLPEATIQVPFLADLVTLADPRSNYSFLNYLKQTGRLHPFYIRESFYPLREEYNEYCRWVADQLPGLRWNQQVTSISPADDDGWRILTRCTRTGAEEELTSARVVLGVGTQPHLPESLRARRDSPRLVHSEDYLANRKHLLTASTVAIVGSGQSAAEIYRDLVDERTRRDLPLNWYTRSPRFFPMEYTKLTLEMTSPEYAGHLRALPTSLRDELLNTQAALHKGISQDLINDIYDTLYRLSLHHRLDGRLIANVEVGIGEEPAGRDPDTPIALTLRQLETGKVRTDHVDYVVAATGYAPEAVGELLENCDTRIRRLPDGRLDVAEDFTIDDSGSLYVQNAEGHITGVNAPDLGMGPWRNSIIVNDILGTPVYQVEHDFTFQDFDIP